MQNEAKITRLDPEWEVTHHSQIAELLRKNNIFPEIENDAITALDWAEKEEDQAFVNYVHSLLIKIDFDAAVSIYEQLGNAGFFENFEDYLSSSITTYNRLNDEHIPVSSAHEGTTPYQHSLNVLKELKIGDFVSLFDGSEAQQGFIIQCIMDVLFHDWGKMIIAQRDTHQYHAEISYLLTRELGLLTENQLAALRYHHIFQLLDSNTEEVTIQDIRRELFPDTISFAYLTILASADVASVQSYEAFAVGGLLDVISGLTLDEIGYQQSSNILALIQEQVSLFLKRAEQALLVKKEYLEEKIRQVRDFVNASGREVAPIFLETLQQIISEIENLFQGQNGKEQVVFSS